MFSINGSRFASLCLIAGPILYVAAEIVRPGGLVLASDSQIEAMIANLLATLLSEKISTLGLLATMFGLRTLLATGHGSWRDALGRFGLITLAIGMAGFVFGNVLNYILGNLLSYISEQVVAYIPDQELALWDVAESSVVFVRMAVVAVFGSAVMLGNFGLAISLSNKLPTRFQRGFAIFIVAISVAGLIAQALAEYVGSVLFYAAASTTLPVAIWYIVLGVGLWRMGSGFVGEPSFDDDVRSEDSPKPPDSGNRKSRAALRGPIDNLIIADNRAAVRTFRPPRHPRRGPWSVIRNAIAARISDSTLAAFAPLP